MAKETTNSEKATTEVTTRPYFIPEVGVIEAASLEEAIAQATTKGKVKEGDGK